MQTQRNVTNHVSKNKPISITQIYSWWWKRFSDFILVWIRTLKYSCESSWSCSVVYVWLACVIVGGRSPVNVHVIAVGPLLYDALLPCLDILISINSRLYLQAMQWHQAITQLWSETMGGYCVLLLILREINECNVFAHYGKIVCNNHVRWSICVIIDTYLHFLTFGKTGRAQVYKLPSNGWQWPPPPNYTTLPLTVLLLPMFDSK